MTIYDTYNFDHKFLDILYNSIQSETGSELADTSKAIYFVTVEGIEVSFDSDVFLDDKFYLSALALCNGFFKEEQDEIKSKLKSWMEKIYPFNVKKYHYLNDFKRMAFKSDRNNIDDKAIIFSIDEYLNQKLYEYTINTINDTNNLDPFMTPAVIVAADKYWKTVQMGYVYLIRNGEHFKIGMTSNPKSRIETYYRTETPHAYEVLAMSRCLDYKEQEKILHEIFASKRFRGEWFSLDESELERALNYYKYINCDFDV